jgi:hypothetical protein
MLRYDGGLLEMDRGAGMPTMDAATSLRTAEQALRDLVTAIMSKEHGASWMDMVVDPSVRERWREVREQEARQRVGHTLGGASDLSYAFLGDLVDLIRKKGHWKTLFEPVLGPRDEMIALFNILQTVRRPVDHSRPLLPFEEDLISGIAGRIRNLVTIYLSNQDQEGEYYPRIERIEDSFGNCFTYKQDADLSQGAGVATDTVLRVGDAVTFRCEGMDAQGRTLGWKLLVLPPPTGVSVAASGDQADLIWTMRSVDTGPNRPVGVILTHEGPYHRNVSNHPGADGMVFFYYRVLPPS